MDRGRARTCWPWCCLGPLALFGPKGILQPRSDQRNDLDRADEVFLQDLVTASERGIHLGNLALGTGASAETRKLGADLSEQDRLLRTDALKLAA
jgi:hypothetical protein